MQSRIYFTVSLLMVLCWIFLFTFFDEIIYIHLVAVVALTGYGLSLFISIKSKNKE